MIFDFFFNTKWHHHYRWRRSKEWLGSFEGFSSEFQNVWSKLSFCCNLKKKNNSINHSLSSFFFIKLCRFGIFILFLERERETIFFPEQCYAGRTCKKGSISCIVLFQNTHNFWMVEPILMIQISPKRSQEDTSGTFFSLSCLLFGKCKSFNYPSFKWKFWGNSFE